MPVSFSLAHWAGLKGWGWGTGAGRGCQPHEKQTALNKRALTGQDLSTALVSWDAHPQLRRGAFCHCRDLDENIDIDLPEVSPLAWLGSMGFR